MAVSSFVILENRMHLYFSDEKLVIDSIVSERENDTISEIFNITATSNETEVIAANETDLDGNLPQTENTTERKIEVSNSTTTPKWFCKGRNNSEHNDSLPQSVIIVNAEELLQIINSTSDNETDSCAVVLFFTRYCPFSAKLSPLYNAMGRVYNNLPILAVDAHKQHR